MSAAIVDQAHFLVSFQKIIDGQYMGIEISSWASDTDLGVAAQHIFTSFATAGIRCETVSELQANLIVLMQDARAHNSGVAISDGAI